MRNPDPEYLIPISSTDYQIMLALAERPLHGYAIIDQCRTDSENIIEISPGTLYPALARLERFKYIHLLKDNPLQGSPRTRKVYELTPTGHLVFEQETRRLSLAVNMAKQRLVDSANTDG